MVPKEVSDELVQVAADTLRESGLWGAWEREQTEAEVRRILATVLPLHEQQLREQIATYLERDLTEARRGDDDLTPGAQRVMDVGDSVLRHAAIAVRDGGGST